MINELSNVIANLLDMSEEQIKILLEIPPNEQLGDYSLPCFSFSKIFRKSPLKIAEEIKERLDSLNIPFIEKIIVTNGYLNIFVYRPFFIKFFFEQQISTKLSVENIGNNKIICLDFSSPNIAKNFHVGHLRTTIIGNSLYKIFSKLGYHVIRINHLGDWGTQFGKLILAYKYWSNKQAVEEKGIDELLRIYILFHENEKKNPLLLEEARLWFLKLEHGDSEALEIWKWFKDISMKEFNRVYKLLDIEFDYFTGESFYMDKVPAIVKELRERKLLEKSQGAFIVSLEDFNMAPCLITKSDGTSIYPSRDLAAILYRKDTFHFDQCIYVTGLEQKFHFSQIFKVIERMGYDWYDELIHIPYGLVCMDGEKLSTRNGNVVYAEDILKEAISRAKKAIKLKNLNLKNIEKTSEMVGVGAIIFHDLFHHRIKNINFLWEEVLNFEGSTGPYVQYTYARAKSILRKNPNYSASLAIDYSILNEDYSYSLVRKLSYYSQVLSDAAKFYEPSILARYVIELAQGFNKFYHKCTVNNSEPSVKQARLLLVDTTQKIIKESMELLGIQCPEEM